MLSALRTCETEDLHHHINQHCVRDLGRLGRNGAREQQTGSNNYSHDEQARNGKTPNRKPTDHDNPSRQLLQHIDRFEREDNLAEDVHDMMQDDKPSFMVEILAKEFPEDLKMLP